MEKLVCGFSRIARKMDECEGLKSAINGIGEAALSDPTSLSDTDKRRLQDFPDADTQLTNVSRATSLTKSELLKRGAERPKDLTTNELNLLRLRYWSGSDYNQEEMQGLIAAYDAFDSEVSFKLAHEQLAKARRPLYEELEEKALANADPEFVRRMQEAALGGPGAREKRMEKAERAVASARPWVRRLWEEDGSDPFPVGKPWGWAVYVAPSVASDRDLYDEYMARADGALVWARIGICCGEVLSARWELQFLEWPQGVEWGSGLDGESGAGPQQQSKEQRAAFEKLRENFTALLQHPAEKRCPTMQQNPESEGEKPSVLYEGILRNTFLVIDQACVDDTVGTMKGVVDDMWVWAVDPFHKDNPEGKEDSAPTNDGYPGYFRVRLQQLTNTFYEARRFSEAEYSMEKLCEIALESRKQTFISVKEEERQNWLPSRDIGSAMRPPKTST